MAITPAAADISDGLHGALLALARGRLGALPAVYDQSVESMLRLALARTRGDRPAAEDLLVRAYGDVSSRADDYPNSQLRALPWVLAVTARA